MILVTQILEGTDFSGVTARQSRKQVFGVLAFAFAFVPVGALGAFGDSVTFTIMIFVMVSIAVAYEFTREIYGVFTIVSANGRATAHVS